MAKKKKRKKTNIAKDACKWAQRCAKLIETDRLGYGQCCSCGQTIHYNEANGGHFQAKGRSYNGACLDQRNIHLQCVKCNCHLNGNPAGYIKFMRNKYPEEEFRIEDGEEVAVNLVIEELELKSYETTPREFAEQQLKKYKALCATLAKDKDFQFNMR
jgi:hypothetical protein